MVELDASLFWLPQFCNVSICIYPSDSDICGCSDWCTTSKLQENISENKNTINWSVTGNNSCRFIQEFTMSDRNCKLGNLP